MIQGTAERVVRESFNVQHVDISWYSVGSESSES